MKDYTKEELQPIGKIQEEAVDLIDFCLEQLYQEKGKVVSDKVCKNLTFEELLGALLKAKYEIEMWQRDR